MRLRWIVALPILAAAMLGAAGIQRHIDTMRDDQFDEELLYLPNEKLLNHFTAGLSSVVADLLWLKTIQYTVREFHNVDSKYTWLEHMCRTVTRLDPHFHDAYAFSGTLLAAIGNDESALRILKSGMPNNPESWEIPFEAVKIYVLNRRNEPDSTGLAMHYLNMTAERSPNPETFTKWAADIQSYHNIDDVGEQIWINTYNTTSDEFLRDMAARNIARIQIRRDCDTLTQLAADYIKRFQKAPDSLVDLVAVGLLEAIPEYLVENEYRINEVGVVTNTLLIDEELAKLLKYLDSAITTYEREHGRFPDSLDAWAAETGRKVPAHPYAEKQWVYDPVTGKVM